MAGALPGPVAHCKYISDLPWMERMSKGHRMNVSYAETRFAYFRLTSRTQLSISSLWNGVEVHIKPTLLSRLMVSDLPTHTYSIPQPILTSCYSILINDPTPEHHLTPRIPFNGVFQLRISLEWFPLLHSKHNFSILNDLNLWLPAHTECYLSYTKHLGAGMAHPAWQKLLSKSILVQYVKAAVWMP